MKGESAPFWDHVEELRKTVLKSLLSIFLGFFLSIIYHKELIDLLSKPLLGEGQKLIFFSPTEGISSVFTLAFWFSAVITAPIWLFFIFRFIAPALEKEKRGSLVLFFLLALVFLAIGVVFSYTFTLPIANHYLYYFNEALGENLWSFSAYFSYTVFLLLANGFVFETFVVLLFCIYFGVLPYEKLKKSRRFFVVFSFFLAALLTPPDILSQLLLAIPMVVFYELSLLYAKFKRKSC